MLHIKFADRIRQTRGVSVFSSIFNRLDSIKDYEESELVAARVAAAITGYIKKGTPDLYTPTGATNRELAFEPGMIVDSLAQGEELAMLDPKRPNPELNNFRNSQLKAVAGGSGTSYSTISKDYEGSYSSRRQEGIEQYSHYGVLWHYYSERRCRPHWESVVRLAILSGEVEMPDGVDELSITDCDFSRPPMPAVAPGREVSAPVQGVNAGLTDRGKSIRQRGDTPADVRRRIEAEQAKDTPPSNQQPPTSNTGA